MPICSGACRATWFSTSPIRRITASGWRGPVLDGLSQNLGLGSGLQTLVNNPFASGISSGVLSQARVATQQLLLPYPQYTGLTVINSTSGNSIYHSMQLKAEKRMAHGVEFLFFYTAGKLISDTSKAPADFGSYNQQPRTCRIGTTCRRSGPFRKWTYRNRWRSVMCWNCR